MPDQRILRLNQTDSDGNDLGSVLLCVEKDGSLPLDLKLIATDNESVYVGKSKSSASSLRHNFLMLLLFF